MFTRPVNAGSTGNAVVNFGGGPAGTAGATRGVMVILGPSGSPLVVARTTLVSATSNSTTWDTSGATLGGSIGDLLIAVISSDGAPTLSAATNAPNGNDWTKLGQASNSTIVTGAVF